MNTISRPKGTPNKPKAPKADDGLINLGGGVPATPVVEAPEPKVTVLPTVEKRVPLVL